MRTSITELCIDNFRLFSPIYIFCVVHFWLPTFLCFFRLKMRNFRCFHVPYIKLKLLINLLCSCLLSERNFSRKSRKHSKALKSIQQSICGSVEFVSIVYWFYCTSLVACKEKLRLVKSLSKLLTVRWLNTFNLARGSLVSEIRVMNQQIMLIDWSKTFLISLSYSKDNWVDWKFRRRIM